ncbi:MAG: BlaI/MecI/CopY family transcriptional regulator, partial [Verrucomicrobiota bacterium]
STVREVTEFLAEDRGEEVGYTTVLKLLQLMHEKGLVTRDESKRSHLYSAAHAKEAMQRSVLSDLAHRIFGGEATDLALQAISSGRQDPEKLKRLREYIESIESEENE